MRYRLSLAFFFLLPAMPPVAAAADLSTIVHDVVSRHMAEKQIPGLSVAIVQDGETVFSEGYGKASLAFDVPASPETVYPISSVSKLFAGLLAVRLAGAGKLDLDASIAAFFDEVPADKQPITVRHLLQHTHGLEDFYRSEDYRRETGKTVDASSVDELARWSLNRPARFSPGADWEYGLAGYVLLGRVFELAGGRPYPDLVKHYVFEPVGMTGTFGGTEAVVHGRNPVLYELVDNEVSGRVVEFPETSYAAGGFNTSVRELARLFVALSGDEFIDEAAKQALWDSPVLAGGKPANYGLGWFSYTTSRDRWVVGHEGGGASWVIYYPEPDLAVIALSNMSGARADGLPYEIARNALAEGLLQAD